MVTQTKFLNSNPECSWGSFMFTRIDPQGRHREVGIAGKRLQLPAIEKPMSETKVAGHRDLDPKP